MSDYTSEPIWASGTITYSFADTTYAQDVFHPFDAPLDAADQAIVNEAIQAWEQVSGLTFVEVPDSANAADAADIRIGFTDLNTQTTGTVGWTSFTSSNGTFNPDVVVQLENPAQLALTGSASNPTYQGTSSTLLQLAEHEIGHAIGLGENMTDPTSIEYPLATSTDQTLDATDIAAVQAMYPIASAPVLITDTTTGTSSTVQASRFIGPDNGVQWKYVSTGSDSVNMLAETANVALVGGPGNDVLVASAGTNVLDGGGGSNYLVGGTGRDTFAVHAGSGAAASWDTIANFHQGDVLKVWGVSDPGRIDWIGIDGAPGSRGATLEVHAGGHEVRVTFAGMTKSEASHLSVTSGSSGGSSFVAFHDG